MLSRTHALYLALALAAIADVVTRALVPASVVDLSPAVVLVGYGAGFAILKTAMLAAVVGQSELMRRIPGGPWACRPSQGWYWPIPDIYGSPVTYGQMGQR